jgi:hypothetical protein
MDKLYMFGFAKPGIPLPPNCLDAFSNHTARHRRVYGWKRFHLITLRTVGVLDALLQMFNAA